MQRFGPQLGIADNLTSTPAPYSNARTGMQGIPKEGENPGEKKPGKNRAVKGFVSRYQTTGKVSTDFPNRVSIS